MRALVSFLAAICMSLALFYLMRHMISVQEQPIAKPPPGASVSFVNLDKMPPGQTAAKDSATLAPKPSPPPSEPLPLMTEHAPTQPPPPAPALEAVLPKLEQIVPNGNPYLGRFEKPLPKIPLTAPKPVTAPRNAARPERRPRKAAANQTNKSAQGPKRQTLGATPNVAITGGGSGPASGPAGSGGAAGDPGLDDEVVALLKLPPKYPRKAARAGKEGWVKLEFTITRDGNVTDAAVVASRPRRLFDRAALRAIRKWRFKPKIQGGKPVARRATQIIEFSLAKK